MTTHDAPAPADHPTEVDPSERSLGHFSAGFNCCEAVLWSLNETRHLGLPATACGLATPFGAGLSGAKETCGALTGGLMALGLALGRSEVSQPAKPAVDAGKCLYDRFLAEFGSIRCQELTGQYGWDQPERRQACQAYVRFAARNAADVIDATRRSSEREPSE